MIDTAVRTHRVLVETTQHCPTPLLESIGTTRQALEGCGGLDHSALAEALEAAEIVGTLTEDATLARAVLIKISRALTHLPPETLRNLVGREAADTAAALAKLGEIGLPSHWSPSQGLDTRQAETLRKMLLAVVSDPRLIVARLAEQVVALRHARDDDADARARLALETRAVFAPLANRLGVWQLKWELEDLALRYLEPEVYRRIATALSERRADREQYIEALCAALRAALRAAGIDAQVYGRPKHIYSIYRKMQRKHLAFEQLFDVRAVRVIVGSIPECYAALGVVHARWPYIPGEFDDYIATPKGNAYRSIHTAVIGPQDKSVEVQIRTREMHEHAELGVAAHWTYKEGSAADVQYQRKIEAVRRMLVPGALERGGAEGEFLEQVGTELFRDRVYVLTPKGEVVDLPHGATPLDYAYSVHTSLGHRCRGAKVNGRIVPLTHVLANGEVVEIIAAKQNGPSRDWLAPELGYLASARNRAKVRAWFRKLDAADNRNAGRVIAERELTRLGVNAEQLPELLAAVNARDTDQFHQLLGEGEITVPQLNRAVGRLRDRHEAQAPTVARTHTAGDSPVDIEGVGDLPVTLARCCAPLRPQPIVGYITMGRGVTIHRRGCANCERMRAIHAERVLQVEWSLQAAPGLPVKITIHAYDRRGLVRDLTDVLAFERLSIQAMSTTTDRDAGTAQILFELMIADDAQLQRLLLRLRIVPNVTSVRRER
jgi:GTP pyrophosphokinase